MISRNRVYLLQIGHKMKLAAITLVGLGLIGVAQAQVQTNPDFEQRYLPVPELLPELPFDTGLSAIDAVMFSQTMRGSVQDESATPPAAGASQPEPLPVVEAAVAGKPPAQQLADQPSPQAVAIQDPTVLVPGEPEPAETAPAEAEKPAIKVKEKQAEKPKKDVITVIVEGVESSKGTVNVGVCNTALSKAGCPYSSEVKAAAGFVETQFEGIPPGRYAVVGYHDVNGNNEHDKNFLGVPKEPYALSNNAGAQMIPTFKDAAVNIKKGENTVIITMRRFGGS